MSFQGAAPVLFEEPTNTTLTLGANSPVIGTRVQKDGNMYLFVYNGGADSITAGHSAGPMTGTTGYTASVSSVTQIDYAYGLCVSTIPTLGYGWLLTEGFGDFKAGGTMNIADQLMVGVGGLIATAIAGQLAPNIGKVRVTTTGGSGYAFFRF